MDPLKMYFLLKMVIFYCYVSLPEVISKAGVVVSVQPDMFKWGAFTIDKVAVQGVEW